MMEAQKKIEQIPSGWKWCRLGDILEPSKERVDPNVIEEIAYIGLEHIERDTGRLLGHGNSSEVKSLKARFFEGDLLYGKLRPYLNKVHVAGFEGVCSTDILVFPKTEFISNKYLLFQFLQPDFVRFANLNVSGVQHPRVDLKKLADFEIPIAPLPEQHRIVALIEELFSRLDAGVEELKKAKTQLQRYRQSVLKAAVEGRLTQEWRKAHPDVEPAERLLERVDYDRRSRINERYNKLPNSDLVLIPELRKSWTITTLNHVAECLDYKRSPINKKERLNRLGSIPYYGANGQVGWIDDYLFDEPLVLVVEDETFTDREKPFSYKISGKSWVNNHAHVLRTTAAIYMDYLNYSLEYYPFTPLTTGTTGRKKLTQLALMSAAYALPPLAEQQEIIRSIELHLSINDQIEKTIETSLMYSNSLRQSVLKRAFEGKLVPQDPNDEPASILLERIKAERTKHSPPRGRGRSINQVSLIQ
jgi:type I restriction enzyme, S subunit